MGFFDWLGLTGNGKALEMGDPAPDVATLDHAGNAVRLADFYGEGYTLVYFYPKADTFGCTIQACTLRDAFDELRIHGVRVVGVSTDRPEAQERFRGKYHLPFVLLADRERAVAKAFGVPIVLGMTRRQSFLIKDGKIVWRDLHASPRKQAADVLQVVEKLGNATPGGS
ncbi:MAG: peroxiredoxin [Methylacidiphilales bacterium]|nr:peroxiredoxin [Candidatus Methylacidiphilales bacterium]